MTQEVFGFFYLEHDLTLLESEYYEIQRLVNDDLCREIIEWGNKLSSANSQLAESRSMVVELAAMLKDKRDYLIEALNAASDDARPRYERLRQLIRNDVTDLDALVAKAEAL